MTEVTTTNNPVSDRERMVLLIIIFSSILLISYLGMRLEHTQEKLSHYETALLHTEEQAILYSELYHTCYNDKNTTVYEIIELYSRQLENCIQIQNGSN